MLPTAPPQGSILIVPGRLNSIGNYLVGRCLEQFCRFEAETIQTNTAILHRKLMQLGNDFHSRDSTLDRAARLPGIRFGRAFAVTWPDLVEPAEGLF